MPHFPEWFVVICVLLPILNALYKVWKKNKKKLILILQIILMKNKVNHSIII